MGDRQVRSGRVELETGKWINMADRELLRTTPFHESRIVQKNPQLVLNSDLPLSERRDDITETNGGTVTKHGGEYRLRATSTTDSKAMIRSRQRGNYLTGSVMDPGLGLRVPVQPTGDAYVEWGYKDDDNGIYLRYDSSGIHARVMSGGTVVESTEQANWNRDNLLGTNTNANPSGGTLDLSDGNIFQFPFVYYGYGGIQWEIGVETRFQDYELVSVHEVKMKGDVSIEEPNLPLTVEVDSGTSGQQLDVFLGGRQISPLGTNDNTARSVGGYRLGVGSIGTSFIPMVSFRHKTGFKNILVRLSGLSIIPDVDMIVEIHRNGTLTSPSYVTPGNHTAAEIATEWDLSATSTYTPGETIYEDFVAGGNKGIVSGADLPRRPISELDTITLALRRVSGSNGTASALFRITEDW